VDRFVIPESSPPKVLSEEREYRRHKENATENNSDRSQTSGWAVGPPGQIDVRILKSSN